MGSSRMFGLLVFLSGNTIATSVTAQRPPHRQHPLINWTDSAAPSDPTTAERLQSAVQMAGKSETLDRVAVYNLGYPTNLEEYKALGGHGLLWVTAVTRDSSDLPLSKAYVRDSSRGAVVLHVLGFTCGRVGSTDREISTAVGTFRCDAFYAFPIILRSGTGELLVDFAKGRRGFQLTQFDGRLPPPLQMLGVAPATPVADEAFAPFLAREYPEIAPRLRRPCLAAALALACPRLLAPQNAGRAIPREMGGYHLGAPITIPPGTECEDAAPHGIACSLGPTTLIGVVDGRISVVSVGDSLIASHPTDAYAVWRSQGMALVTRHLGRSAVRLLGPPDTAYTERTQDGGESATAVWNDGGWRFVVAEVVSARDGGTYYIYTHLYCSTSVPDWLTRCLTGEWP